MTEEVVPKSRAAAVEEVKKEMIARCKEEKLDATTLFTEFVPSCVDDDLVYRFSLTRNHDAPSAAKRVIKLCRCLNDLEMKSLDIMDDDVAAGLKLGCYFWPTSSFPGSNSEKSEASSGSTEVYSLDRFADTDGSPVMYCYGHRIDWDKVTVRQFQKASVFAMIQMTRTTERVQTHGLSFVFLMKDMRMGQIKMEFETFILKIMQEALPMKYTALYVAHEPFFVSSILWPIFKPLMKKKLKERLHWLGSKKFEKNIHPHFADDGACLPDVLGGKFSFDADHYFQETLNIHGSVGGFAKRQAKHVDPAAGIVSA